MPPAIASIIAPRASWFVHRNFPAHFGHIATHLSRELGWECTFVSEVADAEPTEITLIPYAPQGGSTECSHYFS